MSPKFELEERLDEAKQRGVGVDMAVPLHERIDELCERVYEAGHARPSKRKMLAALVLASPTNPAELDTLLRDYDRARVRDALVASPADGTVVELPNRKSGPRPKRTR
jgi:hypothetical protein